MLLTGSEKRLGDWLLQAFEKNGSDDCYIINVNKITVPFTPNEMIFFEKIHVWITIHTECHSTKVKAPHRNVGQH